MTRCSRHAAAALAVFCLCLSGCASVRAAPHAPLPQEQQPAGEPAAEQTKSEPAREEEGGHGILWPVLMYIPNRVIDIFDMARFGVDVGPGIGLDGQATDALQARAIAQTSVGAGLQSLRHSPIQTGVQSAISVGPVGGDGQVGGWYRSPTDIRLGAHAAIVGAHAAVDPVEIADLVLGFVFIDIRDDDL